MASDERGFQTRKFELEEKLERLEKERVSLIEEVKVLREEHMLLDLEKKAGALQLTVNLLRREKEELEGKIAALGARSQV